MTNKGQAVRGREEPLLTPLYHQIYLILRRRILDGELETNRPLPGENRLAREFGVSRVTIRKALHNLEQDGFIVKRCGIGSFPVPQAVEFRDRYNIGSLAEADTDPADNARPRTLSIETVSPPARVREKLAHASGETNTSGAMLGADERRVLRLTRLRSIRGEPFTIMTAWFSAEHAANIDHRELKKMPPPAALEAIGIALTHTEQRISAQNADETTAPLLKVPVGTALIFMGTVFYDRNNHPVMVMESLYRPDLYEYRSTMRRNRSGEWV